MKKEKLVVIGNGMAGARVVEEILQRAPDRFEIAMFGAEPYGNYNRIALSNVLNQTQPLEDVFINPPEWYAENKIRLHLGVKAFRIDRKAGKVLGKKLPGGEIPYAAHNAGQWNTEEISEPYDYVIIATGSRPTIPPLEGFGQPGTFVFRSLDDCAQIASYAKNCRRAVVLGGGLLGLEAARGLLTHHLDVTIVEAAGQLMPNQLDQESGTILQQSIEAMGIRVLVSARAIKIEIQDQKVTGITLKDGSLLKTDILVATVGIRAITEVAFDSGLTVNKGIVCDDQMRTNDPAIFALGECIEHREKLYGLVDPIWEQVRVLADVITGVNLQASYQGSKTSTKLKVMGIELVSVGEKESNDPTDELIVYRDINRRIYKKLIVRDGKIYGAILLGDIEYSDILMRLFASGGKLPEKRQELLFGSVSGVSLLDVNDLPENAQICNCNGVSKKTILDSILKGGCSTVSAVGEKTKAGKGCGSCKGLIAQLIEGALGKVEYDSKENYYVPGVPLEKSQLVAEIKSRELKSVSEVFNALADGKEDLDSKVGLASLLKILWPCEYKDEYDARFINDRVHANIQKDGTFSVVPRIYGGVTTARDLMTIARVAEKYKVPMVKFTGGQRIDLLGVRKEDLPEIWKELGMPSGHAYTKSVRTCKSCVGTDFCRYGLGDSIVLAQKIEKRFQGIETPHKMKLGTAGCPRNCSEAYIKDVGVVAIKGGKWEIYIGGAAGSIIRKGDLLVTVESYEEVLCIMGRFIQYYREHAKYAERTYGFVSRIGVDVLKGILVQDSLGIVAQLDQRIQESVDAYRDPWQEAKAPAYPSQFEGPRLIDILRDAENNG